MTLFLWIAFWYMEKAIYLNWHSNLWIWNDSLLSLQFWGKKIFHIDFSFLTLFWVYFNKYIIFKKNFSNGPFSPKAWEILVYKIKPLWDWIFPSEDLRLWSLKCKSWQVYSYFEKGCREKCTQQSWKALWVVLSSLFFREIWKNWHERPWKCVCEC